MVASEYNDVNCDTKEADHALEFKDTTKKEELINLRVQSSIQVKASYHSAFCKTERSFMSYVNWCSLNAVGIYK